MTKTPTKKLYIVRKWIMATSASDAIRQDKKRPVDDVWVEDDFRSKINNNDTPVKIKGFGDHKK